MSNQPAPHPTSFRKQIPLRSYQYLRVGLLNGYIAVFDGTMSFLITLDLPIPGIYARNFSKLTSPIRTKITSIWSVLLHKDPIVHIGQHFSRVLFYFQFQDPPLAYRTRPAFLVMKEYRSRRFQSELLYYRPVHF